MSLAARITLGFAVSLGGITTLHSWLNHDLFQDKSRPKLTVAHLPVT